MFILDYSYTQSSFAKQVMNEFFVVKLFWPCMKCGVEFLFSFANILVLIQPNLLILPGYRSVTCYLKKRKKYIGIFVDDSIQF